MNDARMPGARALAALSLAFLCAGTARAEILYSIDPRSPVLRTLDVNDASTLTSIPITMAEATIEGGTGLAAHPVTQDLWALLRAGTQMRELVTLDPATGIATRVGTTDVPGLTGLAFASDGVLYAVTGDGGMPPETLFRLSTDDALTTLVATLGAGDDGEALAFNPDDGRMYHASGISGDCPAPMPGPGVCFESIDLGTLSITDIDIKGTQLTLEETFALTYRQKDGAFLWSQGGAAATLYRVLSTGESSVIGLLEDGHRSKGLAVVNRVPTDAFTVAFSTADVLAWAPVPCAETYNVYRLSAQRLADPAGDGVADDYGSCLGSGLSAPSLTDPTAPAPGLTQFYLVTARNELGEAPLGHTSANLLRPNTSACR